MSESHREDSSAGSNICTTTLHEIVTHNGVGEEGIEYHVSCHEDSTEPWPTPCNTVSWSKSGILRIPLAHSATPSQSHIP